MNTGQITEDEVRRALERYRVSGAPDASPLAHLDLVTERLIQAREAPTDQSRAWALGDLLASIVQANLARLRGANPPPSSQTPARDPERASLVADFQGGNADLEAWSCLHHRYLAANPLGVQEIAGIVQPGAPHGRRHVSRRLRRGYALLARVLRDLERAANQRSEAKAAQWPAQPLAAGAMAPAPPVRLPRWRSRYLGREADLADIVAILAPGALVTLVGPPGAGKTRLSVEVAQDVARDCPDGAAFVDLAPLIDGALVVGAIAECLAPTDEIGEAGAAALGAALSGRRALVVLDNCEHLLADVAEVVEALLTECPDLRLLATSRERLNVEGEHVWRLDGLGLPDVMDRATAAAIATAPAVRLFVDRAMSADQRFRLDDDTAPAVAAICRQLEGLPLALELAAARVGALPVVALAEQLHETLDALAGGQRKPGRRAETLGETVLWSVRALPPALQVLFARLGVFYGGWTLAAAAAVSAGEPVTPREVAGHLATLAEKSLLVADTDGEAVRYRYLEPIAQVARELLSDADDGPETRDRLLAWCAELAETAAPALKGADQALWLDRLTAEQDNLRAALRWALAKPSPGAGLRLAAAAWHFWQMRGLIGEGRGHLEALLALADEHLPAALRVQALSGAGGLAREQGDYPAAETHLRAALALMRSTSDEPGEADILRQLGAVADMRGDHEAAIEMLQASLALYQDLGDKWGTAAALNGLGVTLFSLGRYDQARRRLEESLGLYRQIGETWAMGVVLFNLGNVACDEGDLAAAEAHYRDSLATCRDLGDLAGEAAALNGLGHVALRAGDTASARRRYIESGRTLSELGDRHGLAEWLEFLAAVDEAEGQAARAVTRLAAAAAQREALGAGLPIKERAERDTRLRALAGQLGEGAYAAAWSIGAAASWPDILALALAG